MTHSLKYKNFVHAIKEKLANKGNTLVIDAANQVIAHLYAEEKLRKVTGLNIRVKV